MYSQHTFHTMLQFLQTIRIPDVCKIGLRAYGDYAYFSMHELMRCFFCDAHSLSYRESLQTAICEYEKIIYIYIYYLHWLLEVFLYMESPCVYL